MRITFPSFNIKKKKIIATFTENILIKFENCMSINRLKNVCNLKITIRLVFDNRNIRYNFLAKNLFSRKLFSIYFMVYFRSFSRFS